MGSPGSHGEYYPVLVVYDEFGGEIWANAGEGGGAGGAAGKSISGYSKVTWTSIGTIVGPTTG